MPQAQPLRRRKSYSSDTGYVYQYYFQQMEKQPRGAQAGSEYTYMVSVDRKTAFPLRIFVSRAAVEGWGRANGRELSGTEEYAAVKMRLFQAFDEVDHLTGAAPDLVVDETNLSELLARLNL